MVTTEAGERTFTIVLEEAEEGGYVVTCPALPGLVTEGDSLDEAVEMARDAIGGYLDSLRGEGLPIPPDRSVGLRQIQIRVA